jgi:hypothetical protein
MWNIRPVPGLTGLSKAPLSLRPRQRRGLFVPFQSHAPLCIEEFHCEIACVRNRKITQWAPEKTLGFRTPYEIFPELR